MTLVLRQNKGQMGSRYISGIIFPLLIMIVGAHFVRINGVPLFWSRKVSIRFFHHLRLANMYKVTHEMPGVLFFFGGIPGKQILNKQDKIGISWIWPPPCNSGKWRFIGIPDPKNDSGHPGGHWNPGRGPYQRYIREVCPLFFGRSRLS